VNDVRSRAGQLLAAAGFVAVLASIGSSIASNRARIFLTCVLMGLAIYGLLGTLWLTLQAVGVREWEPTMLEPVFDTRVREVKERHAGQLYRTCKRDALRLTIPAGYLMDAQWYFFGTIVLIVALVALRF